MYSTLGIEQARDQTMPLHSKDWAMRGEMLKLTIESRSQWNDEVPCDWCLVTGILKVLQAYI
jgi:hypothetical protein